MTPPLVIYVDVDDTLVRAVGNKRIAMPRVVQHVRDLHDEGAELYCWSTGGAAYARETAVALGIDGCFAAFLPKPHVVLDDQAVTDWLRTIYVHPLQAPSLTLADYRHRIGLL